MKNKIILLLVFLVTTITFSQKKTKNYIPEGFRILEQIVINPDNEEYNQNISFHYDKRGKILKITNHSKLFSYEEIYEYKKNRISRISYVNSDPRLNQITTLNYKNGKLSEMIVERVNKDENKSKNTFIKTGSIEYIYTNDNIEKIHKDLNGIQTSLKEIIFLDEEGNFISFSTSNKRIPAKEYDDKNNPRDLVYKKYLMGYTLYGTGNVLKEWGNIKNEYKYNEHQFPIEKKKFKDGELNTVTTYIYSK